MKIVAVVVTYNRLKCLKELLNSLNEQTYSDFEILIVNNSSTDGTSEWLTENEGDFKVLHKANDGCSGGMYAGYKYAIEQLAADYIWCMDDDGIPTPDCLRSLVTSKVFQEVQNVVVGSVVVSKDDSLKLSFSIPKLSTYNKFLDNYRETTDDVDYIAENGDTYGYPWGMFFNSVLIPTAVLETVGLPKREMFIWGDEVEYFYRIRKSGFQTYLIKESIFLHPKAQPDTVAAWKEKYQFRNYCFIDKVYKKNFTLRTLKKVHYITTNRKWYLFKPLWHGLTNNFTKSYLPN